MSKDRAMKTDRIYEGAWGNISEAIACNERWARKWQRLYSEAADLRYKHTKQGTISFFSKQFPETKGKITRLTIEELAEEGEAK